MKLFWLVNDLLKPKGILLRYSCALWQVLSFCQVPVQATLQQDLVWLQGACLTKAHSIDFIARNQRSSSELEAQRVLSWAVWQVPLELMFLWHFYSESLFPAAYSLTIPLPNRLNISGFKGDFSSDSQAISVYLWKWFFSMQRAGVYGLY